MAIGRRGSYATVQPAIVDFGGMVEGASQKIQAEQAAKAKAQAELQKQLPNQELFVDSGFANFDASTREALRPLLEEFAFLKRNATSYDDKARMDEINLTIKDFTNQASSFKQRLDKVVADIEKYNPQYLDVFKKTMQSIDDRRFAIKIEDGKILMSVPEVDGNGEVIEEDGKIKMTGFMTPDDFFNENTPPVNFNLEDYLKKVRDGFEPKINSVINSLETRDITVQDVFKDKRIQSAIDTFAKKATTDKAMMADWYNFKTNGEGFKYANFTEEEKKEAEEFYKQKMLETAKSKYDEAYINQARGGKSVTGITVDSPVDTVINTGVNKSKPSIFVGLGNTEGKTEWTIATGIPVTGVHIVQEGGKTSFYYTTTETQSEGVSVSGGRREGVQTRAGIGDKKLRPELKESNNREISDRIKSRYNIQSDEDLRMFFINGGVLPKKQSGVTQAQKFGI